jgi:hypothetical protein
MKLPESCAEVLLSPEADTTDLNSQAFINNDVMLTFIQEPVFKEHIGYHKGGI